MNPVLECLYNHKSIRKYKDQPLEDEKLEKIIKAAQALRPGVMANKYLSLQLKTKLVKNSLKNYVGVKNIYLNVQYF